jgi:hypothetical protein
MSAINREVGKATSEKLLRPDPSLNSVLTDYVNKHPEKSELVANAVKERILENNTKIQMLALFLLDTLMKKWGFAFHTQIGAKSFMNVIIQLLNNKEVSQQVKKKILQLVQHWGLRFEDESDVLPLFTNVYSALKQRSLPFPSEEEAKKQVRKTKDTAEGKVPMAPSKPLDKKHAKLRKDLEVVIENIVLTNEMIDWHNIDDEVDENDALISLTQTLKSFENKIMEIIEKIKHDEVMNIALQTNDDLQKTLKRYKRLENGRAPDSYQPEWRKFLKSYKPENDSHSKPAAQKPKQRQEVRRPEPVQSVGRGRPQQVNSRPKDDDIFGFADSTPVHSAPSAQPVGGGRPQQNQDSLFGNAPSSGSDTGINKLNEIMMKMTLDKNEKEKAAQFAPQQMHGGGGQGFGGPGPGMFNTGMPQPGGMYGGNMMGGQGMGGPPMGGQGMSGPPMGGQGMGFGGQPMGPGPGQFATGFNQQPPRQNFGGGFGGQSVCGNGSNNPDPFMGGGSIFNTAAPNYNPGGGPQAFKNNPRIKKAQEGPKEFNQLFSMADKITDRTNQPQNRVEDYVTTYKNNAVNQNDMYRGNQNNSQSNDMFGNNQSVPASNNGQSDDPFGGFGDSYGGDDMGQSNDIYGGGAQDDIYGGGAQDDIYGGSAQTNSQPDMYNNASPQFDVYGGGEPSNDPYGGEPSNDPYGGEPSNDVYGGYDEPAVYDEGYGNNSQPTTSQDNYDFGNGGDMPSHDNNMYGQDNNEPNYTGGGNMYDQPQNDNKGMETYFGNTGSQGNTDHNKQEELFDIFG